MEMPPVHSSSSSNYIQVGSPVRTRHLTRDTYVFENLDRLSFSLILGKREKLAGGLSYFIKELLLCLQEGFSVIRQMVPHLQCIKPNFRGCAWSANAVCTSIGSVFTAAL